jgi:pescadillo protein
LPEESVIFQNIKLETAEKNTEDDEHKIDEEFRNQEDVKKIIQKEKKASKKLFEGLVFFLSREVQKDLFELCIKAFSGRVVYDGANFESAAYKSNEITHVISDRNIEHIPILPNREYVQPQWLCDSINFAILLPVSDYKPGKVLPPHLSPFVSDEKEGFVPERKKEILKLQGEYVEESINESEGEEEEKEELPKAVQTKTGKSNAYKVQDEEFDMDKKQLQVKKKAVKKEKDNEELQELMLTKKRQRLLEKIKNFDDKKKEKVRQIIERKKELKKESAKKGKSQ